MAPGTRPDQPRIHVPPRDLLVRTILIGAFLAAWLGAVASGFLLEGATIPNDIPAGVRHVLYAMPGCLLGLTGCWMLGARAS
jgi:hypothetical protein